MLLFYCKDTVQYVCKKKNVSIVCFLIRVSNAKKVVVSLQSNHRSEQQFTREKQKNPMKSYTLFLFFLGWSTLTVLLYMKIYCDATFSCEFVTEM